MLRLELIAFTPYLIRRGLDFLERRRLFHLTISTLTYGFQKSHTAKPQYETKNIIEGI
jgi:hypothetical protein